MRTRTIGCTRSSGGGAGRCIGSLLPPAAVHPAVISAVNRAVIPPLEGQRLPAAARSLQPYVLVQVKTHTYKRIPLAACALLK